MDGKVKEFKTMISLNYDAGHGSPDGNLIWGDHTDWADARLVKSELP